MIIYWKEYRNRGEILVCIYEKKASKKALNNNAIGEMYKNAELKGNQQIINITTTQSVESWALIYSKVRAKAHGYVIEFE